MPTISYFRGITITINWNEHNPPHFHANYGNDNISVSIKELEVICGEFPSKQLKMVLGWAAIHQSELLENWEFAMNGIQTFKIKPLD